MNRDPLEMLLEKRDALAGSCCEFGQSETCRMVENEEIRELARIVLEATEEETTVFSTT